MTYCAKADQLARLTQGELMEISTQGRAHSGRLRTFIIGGSALLLAATTSAVAVAASSSPRALSGAGVTYVVMPPIVGEGGTGIPTGGIEISSWSWGVGRGISGLAAGKAAFQDLTFVHRIDKSSPLLLTDCAGGTVIASVRLTVSAADASSVPPGDTMTITLTKVHVTSIHSGSSSGGDNPSESVTLNFAKIQIDYISQGSVTVHGGWDLAQNKKA